MAFHYSFLNPGETSQDRHAGDKAEPSHSKMDSKRRNLAFRNLRKQVMTSQPKPKIRINVAGQQYETYEKTLKSKPTCLLAKPGCQTFYNSDADEFFFDRNSKVFEAILTYLQTGVLVKPDKVPDKVYVEDLIFFGFRQEARKHVETMGINTTEEETLWPKNKFQRAVWEFVECPTTSKGAKIFSIISTVIIIFSIVVFCVETLPNFTKHKKHGNQHTTKQAFFYIEAVCVGWFTLEYLVRFYGAPRKLTFIYQPLNVIDLVAILPFYATEFLSLTEANLSSLAILRVLRLVRVFRVFKLSRYSKGLQLLIQTIYASVNELILLFFFLLIVIVLYSSAVYYAEVGSMPHAVFRSIPHTFWLGMVTITTVGYGDMVPETLGGKVIGSLLAVTGVLVIALPIPIIVNNFTKFYQKIMREDEEMKKDLFKQVNMVDEELVVRQYLTVL